MDAMLLAAGLGVRLRPLTDRTPKALLPVAGIPILERVAQRLIDAGADRLIINLHHLGDQIRSFVRGRDDFGVEVLFSAEPDGPLETGGAVRRASSLLRTDQPFFLHNTDILSDIPLRKMYDEHVASSALATLAVMERPTSRRLLFDDAGLLGREDTGKGIHLEVRPASGEVRPLAFGGIHVISPSFLAALEEDGIFSILDPYLRLAGEGAQIVPFRIDENRWIDIGKPETLAEADGWLSGRSAAGGITAET